MLSFLAHTPSKTNEFIHNSMHVIATNPPKCCVFTVNFYHYTLEQLFGPRFVNNSEKSPFKLNAICQNIRKLLYRLRLQFSCENGEMCEASYFE